MSANSITSCSLEEIRRLKSETDWDKVAAAGDHDEPSEFDVDWSKAKIVDPEPKQAISLRVDRDVLAFFKDQGKGYQTRMNAVLRAYMEAKTSGQR